MDTIITIIKAIFEIFKFFKRDDTIDNDKIKKDQQLADNIRNGDGQRVAEDFKRRKEYTK